jgi:hypothetical protein
VKSSSGLPTPAVAMVAAGSGLYAARMTASIFCKQLVTWLQLAPVWSARRVGWRRGVQRSARAEDRAPNQLEVIRKFLPRLTMRPVGALGAGLASSTAGSNSRNLGSPISRSSAINNLQSSATSTAVRNRTGRAHRHRRISVRRVVRRRSADADESLARSAPRRRSTDAPFHPACGHV